MPCADKSQIAGTREDIKTGNVILFKGRGVASMNRFEKQKLVTIFFLLAAVSVSIAAAENAGKDRDVLEVVSIKPKPPAKVYVGDKVEVTLRYRAVSTDTPRIWCAAKVSGPHSRYQSYAFSGYCPKGKGEVTRWFRFAAPVKVQAIWASMTGADVHDGIVSIQHPAHIEWADKYPQVKRNPHFAGVRVMINDTLEKASSIYDELAKAGVKHVSWFSAENRRWGISIGADVPIEAAKAVLAGCLTHAPNIHGVTIDEEENAFKYRLRVMIGAEMPADKPKTRPAVLKQMLAAETSEREFHAFAKGLQLTEPKGEEARIAALQEMSGPKLTPLCTQKTIRKSRTWRGKWEAKDDWFYATEKTPEGAYDMGTVLFIPMLLENCELFGVIDAPAAVPSAMIRVHWNAEWQKTDSCFTFVPATGQVMCGIWRGRREKAQLPPMSGLIPFCVRIRGDKVVLFIQNGRNPVASLSGIKSRGERLALNLRFFKDAVKRIGQVYVRELAEDASLDAPVIPVMMSASEEGAWVYDVPNQE